MKFKKILEKVFKHRTVKRSDGELYLTRYYVFRKPVWWLPSIYIHCFHSSDHDPELHNHGWNKSVSLILKGSYREEIRVNDCIATRILSPGKINYITKNKFHRIDLLSDEVWTLFFSGTKKDPNWGFWNRYTNEYLDWEEHERRKELKNIEEFFSELKTEEEKDLQKFQDFENALNNSIRKNILPKNL